MLREASKREAAVAGCATHGVERRAMQWSVREARAGEAWSELRPTRALAARLDALDDRLRRDLAAALHGHGYCDYVEMG